MRTNFPTHTHRCNHAKGTDRDFVEAAIQSGIRVLGFSDQGEKSKQWYPGDEYCDIIGADTYQLDLFNKLYRKMKGITSDDKPICLHECGKNPTVEQLKKAPYCWFMTWHTQYLTDNNSPEELKELYGSEFVITLDEIGDIYG